MARPRGRRGQPADADQQPAQGARRGCHRHRAGAGLPLRRCAAAGRFAAPARCGRGFHEHPHAAADRPRRRPDTPAEPAAARRLRHAGGHRRRRQDQPRACRGCRLERPQRLGRSGVAGRRRTGGVVAGTCTGGTADRRGRSVATAAGAKRRDAAAGAGQRRTRGRLLRRTGDAAAAPARCAPARHQPVAAGGGR